MSCSLPINEEAEASQSYEDDSDQQSNPKKIKTEWFKAYSAPAKRMMANMGYIADEGLGLGKHNQGRLDPVEPTQREGRYGLGSKIETITWNESMDNITIPEIVNWLQSDSSTTDITLAELRDWPAFGQKKLVIDDETKFCDPEVLKDILLAKSVFDTLDNGDMRRARTKSNPFETIRSLFFLNRAAVKMANIDSICDFMFTEPKDQSSCKIIRENDLLYFADICAGPGGFSEYVLYKKSWEAKGFGFTLRGPNDFQLDNFYAGPPESFDTHYGSKDDGNIFDPENQKSFINYVLTHSGGGVHFVMADGGFSVEGQENIQEILSKQLYLCQCLVALHILRENGHFVCKLFDIFTEFSVGLIFLMYKCFEEITIIKPNTSRPANSERYLVCKWKKPNTYDIQKYLTEINSLLWDGRLKSDEDINELVNIDVIYQNQDFTEFIIKSNNNFGSVQIMALRKIAAFHQNIALKETRQSEFRKKCLQLWNLPDQMRQAPEIKNTNDLLVEVLQDWYDDRNFLSTEAVELYTFNDLRNIESIYDWYFVPVSRSDVNHIISPIICHGRGNILQYSQNGKWKSIENHQFEVSPKSLFLGEILFEFSGEGTNQVRVKALHIIDGAVLGGKDIRRFKLQDRIRFCEKFARSLNKPYKGGSDNKFGPIRCKQLYRLQDFSNFFAQMRFYNLKDNSNRLGLKIASMEEPQKFYVPGGILLFCEISHQFFSRKSTRHDSLYYVDKLNKQSYYLNHMPKECRLYASFRNTFSRRLLWKWQCVHQVNENVQVNEKQPNMLFRDDIQEFIKQNS